MKLRNKKTGEIIEWEKNITYKVGKTYTSLKELQEEWEDYEEPKKYYFIADFGGICARAKGKIVEDEEDRKAIGNYFSTREEAEKAVEKLKAWKRLKDKGFKFIDYRIDLDYCGDIHIEASNEMTCSEIDLDLLFGEEK